MHPMPASVADALVTDVKVSHADTTVRQLRALFNNEHVHAAVIVEHGALLAVVDRADLTGREPDDALAMALGGLGPRVVAPEADLEEARRFLLASGRRRLAVADADGTFHGLLCLKRSHRGFCSDNDVRSRRHSSDTGLASQAS